MKTTIEIEKNRFIIVGITIIVCLLILAVKCIMLDNTIVTIKENGWGASNNPIYLDVETDFNILSGIEVDIIILKEEVDKLVSDYNRIQKTQNDINERINALKGKYKNK